jgi:hypothetical protein
MLRAHAAQVDGVPGRCRDPACRQVAHQVAVVQASGVRAVSVILSRRSLRSLQGLVPPKTQAYTSRLGIHQEKLMAAPGRCRDRACHQVAYTPVL